MVASSFFNRVVQPEQKHAETSLDFILPQLLQAVKMAKDKYPLPSDNPSRDHVHGMRYLDNMENLLDHFDKMYQKLLESSSLGVSQLLVIGGHYFKFNQCYMKIIDTTALLLMELKGELPRIFDELFPTLESLIESYQTQPQAFLNSICSEIEKSCPRWWDAVEKNGFYNKDLNTCQEEIGKALTGICLPALPQYEWTRELLRNSLVRMLDKKLHAILFPYPQSYFNFMMQHPVVLTFFEEMLRLIQGVSPNPANFMPRLHPDIFCINSDNMVLGKVMNFLPSRVQDKFIKARHVVVTHEKNPDGTPSYNYSMVLRDDQNKPFYTMRADLLQGCSFFLETICGRIANEVEQYKITHSSAPVLRR